MFKFQESNSKVYHSSSFIVHISYDQCSTKSLVKGHPYGYVRRFAALKADVWGMCDGSHVKLNRHHMWHSYSGQYSGPPLRRRGFDPHMPHQNESATYPSEEKEAPEFSKFTGILTNCRPINSQQTN